MQNELVLCVRSIDLFRECPSLSETRLSITIDLDWVHSCPTWLVPRCLAEHDPSFKQLIPYVVVIRSGSIGTYLRSKKSSETRLHGTKSIGFGGHVELQDIALLPSKNIDQFSTVMNAARRELYEELSLDSQIDAIGCIYNPSNDVGKVHVGIVASAYVLSTERIQTDASIASLDWLSVDELEKEELEPWSAAVLQSMIKSVRVI